MGYSRTVDRYVDRQKYLETVINTTISKSLTSDISAINPIVTDNINNGKTNKYEPKVKLIGLFDANPTNNNKYHLNIISDFDDEKSTQYSAKTIQTAQGIPIKRT